MLSERTPGNRLITQNMIASAALFESVEIPDWASIQDLSAFIDLFCLYDNVVVISREGLTTLSGWSSDFLGLLSDEHFVEVRNPNINDLVMTASNHLTTFVGEEQPEKFYDLVGDALNEGYRFEITPDRDLEILTGKEWLLTTPNQFDLLKQLEKEWKDAGRGTTFLIRTFLYLSYADTYKISFTPDAVRCPVLEIVLDKEEQFRGKLLSSLKSSWVEDTPGDKELLSRVSPFAAIIFKNADKDKRRIVPEMRKLRDELAQDRKRLRDIEDRALYRSRADALKAKDEWEKVVDEIATSFGVSHPLKVTAQFMLNYAEDIGGVLKDPKSLGSWMKLAELPAHTVSRITARRTTVGIHQFLRNTELPGEGQLRSSIHHLFGL
jgi:hypothetical protein